MKNLVRCTALLIVTALVLAASSAIAATHVPGKERVDESYKRRTEIDGNNVRTSVFNYLFTGRLGGGQGVAFEWPKNTKREYIALLSLWIGGEVVDEAGNTIHIVDLPSYRTSPAGANWNMLPVPGYFNDKLPGGGKIAKSDEPNTWPEAWPDKLTDAVDPGWRGKWNGYFGKNQFSADQEMFYRCGDDNYNRYNYVPDTTDVKRRGLGLIADTRVMEWSQVSVADAVFVIHEFKNDGTKDITKVATTIWLADLVGGDGDSQDDTPDFSLALAVAFSLDKDGKSSNPAYAGAFVGAVATSYLETPGNAVDRIDNDRDSPEGPTRGGNGPIITSDMLVGEIVDNGIDDNGNGLIDENPTYLIIPGRDSAATYADGIDNNGDGEISSPVITQQMINQAVVDRWHRWPPNPETDPFMKSKDGKSSIIHLIGVGDEDLGMRYKDNIDNNGNALGNWPTVTQAMIDQAATDVFHRYRVPGTDVILYNLDATSLGKKYINVDGGRDQGIDEKIDEMIDESRDDGVDNNGDWNAANDDVGLDGAPNTGDPGEGDGIPTSGAGTPFPGEPHIDKTDIAEADMMGLTNVQYKVAGGLDFSKTADIVFWSDYMIPGKFVDPAAIKAAGPGDYDLFVSSGFFPLKAGQTERVSYSAVFGNALRLGDADASGAKADALAKRKNAQLAYAQNYRFAQVPLEPTLSAVAGPRVINGKRLSAKPQVTLYWDETAEYSDDGFLKGIVGDGHDFEGYRIYRSTDPAFQDAKLITDGIGNPAPFLKPIAQFDLKDGIKGFSALAYNGVQFYMGDDTGLEHTWTDTTVQYGQKYYYAIRAYDKGYAPLNITPSESNIRISIDNVTGEVTEVGKSVQIVTPEAPVGGYLDPSVTGLGLVSGSTTGAVGYNLVDAMKVKNARYRVTFEDTVAWGAGSTPDTFRTKTMTLADITNLPRIDTVLSRVRTIADSVEQPVTDGFRLILANEDSIKVNPAASRWSNPAARRFIWDSRTLTVGQQFPNDYKIVFGAVGIDTSVVDTVILLNNKPYFTVPAPINFKVYDTYHNKALKVAFIELDKTGGNGLFTVAADPTKANGNSDVAVITETNGRGRRVNTWQLTLVYDSTKANPASGDTLYINTAKMFRAQDVFEFATHAQAVDPTLARAQLDLVRVVPNPYIAAATWEGPNPFSNGRGPRSLHFTHLPQVCTIRIYTVSGELVQTIEHNSSLIDGSAEWNLLTRDNLSASYGIYIYHVDAPGVGQKVGKFAVIK
jgi:hypothetical protein